MSKSNSYHFVFGKGVKYSDLEKVFPDILNVIFFENNHFQNPEDEESREMFLQLNMYDLSQNRKPEGYNRKGKFRLVFPTNRMEFYIRTNVAKPPETMAVGEKIKEILSTAGIKFQITENDEIAFD